MLDRIIVQEYFERYNEDLGKPKDGEVDHNEDG